MSACDGTCPRHLLCDALNDACGNLDAHDIASGNAMAHALVADTSASILAHVIGHLALALAEQLRRVEAAHAEERARLASLGTGCEEP